MSNLLIVQREGLSYPPLEGAVRELFSNITRKQIENGGTELCKAVIVRSKEKIKDITSDYINRTWNDKYHIVLNSGYNLDEKTVFFFLDIESPSGDYMYDSIRLPFELREVATMDEIMLMAFNLGYGKSLERLEELK